MYSRKEKAFRRIYSPTAAPVKRFFSLGAFAAIVDSPAIIASQAVKALKIPVTFP